MTDWEFKWEDFRGTRIHHCNNEITYARFAARANELLKEWLSKAPTVYGQKEFMIIPVLVGIVIGHFFWPIHEGNT